MGVRSELNDAAEADYARLPELEWISFPLLFFSAFSASSALGLEH